jgi:hypothetical protein
MNTKAIIQSQWVAFPILVPGVIMLILHRQLGLSGALNVATPPGEREAHLFNWVMVSVLYLGVGVFLLHALSLWSRGRFWVFAKLAFLALYWSMILILA